MFLYHSFFCFHIMKGFHVHVCSKFLQSKDVLLKLDFLRPLLRRIRLVHLCLESYPNICDFPHVIVIHVIKNCRGDRLPTEKLHIWRYCLHIFLEAFSFCSIECFWVHTSHLRQSPCVGKYYCLHFSITWFLLFAFPETISMLCTDLRWFIWLGVEVPIPNQWRTNEAFLIYLHSINVLVFKLSFENTLFLKTLVAKFLAFSACFASYGNPKYFQHSEPEPKLVFIVTKPRAYCFLLISVW